MQMNWRIGLAAQSTTFNVDKIYLDAFAQVNAAGGDRYPSVNEAIDRHSCLKEVLL